VNPPKKYYCLLRCLKPYQVGTSREKRTGEIMEASTKKTAEDMVRSGFFELFIPDIKPEQKEPEDFDPQEFFDKDGFLVGDLAALLMKRHTFITLSDTHEVIYYQDGVYVEGGEVLIRKECSRILKDENRRQRVNEIIHFIQGKTYRNREEFDALPKLINLKNGVFDLETWTLKPHSPDVLFMRQLPVYYQEGADCPAIRKFFGEIVRPEDVISLEEIAAFCLMPGYSIQKAAMLQGEGSNGKSTYLNLINAFLGPRNVSGKTLKDLVNNRFATAALYGKYANIFPDLPSAELTATGQFKALTGGDHVSAEKKFKDCFEFMNLAKLIFSANELPKTRDCTRAFYRRWLIIIFPFIFEGSQKDPNLINKLTTAQELSGLLNLALATLKRLMDQGDFTRSSTSEEMARLYERLSNPVTAFLEGCCIIDSAEGIFTPKQALYTTFKLYVQENKLPPLTETAFSKEIKQSPRIGEQRLKIEGERVYCWSGIKLNEEWQKGKLIQKTLDKLDTIDTKNNEIIPKTLDTLDRPDESVHPVQDVHGFSHLSKREHSENRQIRDAVFDLIKKNDSLSGDTSLGEFKAIGATDELILEFREKGYVYESRPGFFRAGAGI